MRLNPFGQIELKTPEETIPSMSHCAQLADMDWKCPSSEWTPVEIQTLCSPLTNLTHLKLTFHPIQTPKQETFVEHVLFNLATQLMSLQVSASQLFSLQFPILETLKTTVTWQDIPACMAFLHRHTMLRHLTLAVQTDRNWEWDFSAIALESLKLDIKTPTARLRSPPTLRSLKMPYGARFDNIADIEPHLALEVFNDEDIPMLKRNRIRNVTLVELAQQYEPECVRKERVSIFRV